MTRGGRISTISETEWRQVPKEWRDAAVDAVVAAGFGETPMAAVAAIACALWKKTQQPGPS